MLNKLKKKQISTDSTYVCHFKKLLPLLMEAIVLEGEIITKFIMKVDMTNMIVTYIWQELVLHTDIKKITFVKFDTRKQHYIYL